MQQRSLWAGVFLFGMGIFRASFALGDEIRYCLNGFVHSLDPQYGSSSTEVEVEAQIYEPLLTLSDSGEILPGLADAAKEVSPLVYELHLKQGVKFHSRDGFHPSRPMNAEDVAFTFNRGLEMAKSDDFFKGAPFRSTGLSEILERVEAKSPDVVRFQLKKKNDDFLPLLSILNGVMSLEYYQYLKGKETQFTQSPVGTGPYVLDQMNAEELRFKPFEDYWQSPPKEPLLIRTLQSNLAGLNLLQSSDCTAYHISAATLNPTELDSLLSDRFALQKAQGKPPAYAYLKFNPGTISLPLRKKIAKTLSKETLNRLVFHNQGLVMQTPFPPSLMKLSESELSQFSQVLMSAREKAAAKSEAEGKVLEFITPALPRPYNPNPTLSAELLLAQLEEAGIRVHLLVLEWGDYLTRLHEGKFDLALGGYAPSLLSRSSYTLPMNTCFKSSLPASATIPASTQEATPATGCNPEFDDLVHEANLESKNDPLYARLLSEWQKNLYYLPLVSTQDSLLLDKRLQGVALRGLGADFKQAQFETEPPAQDTTEASPSMTDAPTP